MNHWLKYALAASMAALCTVQVAQAEGAYGGVGLGMFEMDPGKNKKTGLGAQLFGGIELGPLLAIEARLASSQSVTSARETSQINWLTAIMAKPKYDIAGNANIYALAGVTMMNASFTSVAGRKQNKTTTALSFGFGAELYLNYNTLIGAEWVRYATQADAAVKNISFQGLDVNAFLLNIQMNF
ncbi:MAG: porin family protein [Mariprofundaceae bacterium]|nr:porin family protein [Mariprofundaceae bacterium]